MISRLSTFAGISNKTAKFYKFDLVYKVWKSMDILKIAFLSQAVCFRQTGEPVYLASLIHDKVTTRSLRSSHKCFLEVPRRSTEMAKRSFSFAASSILNSHADDLRQLGLITINTRQKTAQNIPLLGKSAKFAYSQGLVNFYVRVCVLQSFVQVIPKRKKNDVYRFWHFLSDGIIAKFVLCDQDLLFGGKQFKIVISLKP